MNNIIKVTCMYKGFFQTINLFSFNRLVNVLRPKNSEDDLKLGETKKMPASVVTQGHPGQNGRQAFRVVGVNLVYPDWFTYPSLGGFTSISSSLRSFQFFNNCSFFSVVILFEISIERIKNTRKFFT